MKKWTSVLSLITTLTVLGWPFKVVSGTLTVGVQESAPQTAIAGMRQAIGMTVQLFTTASSEGIRVPTFPIILTTGGGLLPHDITNVRLYDGTTPVVTGSNIWNPTNNGEHRFVFDGNGLIRPEGESKALTLRYDIRPEVSGTLQWSIPSEWGEAIAVGLSTGETVRPVLLGGGVGPLITVVEHGELAVSYSSSSPIVVGSEANSVTIRVDFDSSVEAFHIREMEFTATVNAGGTLPTTVVGESNSGGAVPSLISPDGKFTLAFDENNSAIIDGTGFVDVLFAELDWSQLTLTLTRVRAVGRDSGFNLTVESEISHTVRIGSAAVQPSLKITYFPAGEHRPNANWFIEISGMNPMGQYILQSSLDLKNWDLSFPFQANQNGWNSLLGNARPEREFFRLRQ